MSKRLPFKLLIWTIWISTILLRYVRAAIMRFPLIGSYPDHVIAACYVVLIVLSVQEFRLRSGDIVFVFAVTVCFLMENLIRGQGNEYLEAYFPSFLLNTLPLYIVGVALTQHKDEETIIDGMYTLSCITIVVNFIYKVVFGTPMDDVMSQYVGDMDLAYNILPHCCLVAYYARKKTSWINVSLIILGAFYLFMLGTRGAALILLINIAWNLIMGQTSRKTIIRILILCCGVAAFLSSPLYDSAILWMYKMAQNAGLSIRIFDKLLQGVQMGSSGRDVLQDKLLYSIREHLLLGTGLCSDRLIAGTYAHSIVIEFWVNFGVFIGSVLLLLLIVYMVRGFFAAASNNEKGLVMALICAGFLKLLFSGSYLDHALFFLLIGFCVGISRRRKCEQAAFTDNCVNNRQEQ